MQNKGIAVLLGLGKPKADEDEMGGDDMGDGRVEACANILDAIRADDAEMLSAALSDFLSM